jgi:predicted acyltransferase
MIVVNAADLGGHAYPWLRHSLWNGCTPADLVFPGFLVIMGAALGLSLRSYAAAEWSAKKVYLRILRRSLILFGLGLALNFATAPDLGNLRIMGVLQRIALCYLLSAIILLHLSPRAQWGAALLLLLGYWAALSWIPIPRGHETIGAHLPGYVDRMFLGRAHLLQSSPYDSEMDPEGLLTTAPALVNVLLGAFAGRWLASRPISFRTSALVGASGVLALLLGLVMSVWLPLNKALWTSSYALVTSGAALIGFGVCHQLVDVYGLHAIARPFEVIGVNAVVAYLVSTAMNAVLIRSLGSNAEHNLYGYLVQLAPSWSEGPAAALLCALAQVLAIWILVEAMYRRGWAIKI